MILFQLHDKQYEPVHEILEINASVRSEGSGKPTHMGRLARAFIFRIRKVEEGSNKTLH